MPATTTDAGAGWSGWHRASRREPWRLLAQAPTYDRAWGLLLDRIPQGPPGGESAVLREGIDANEGAGGRRA
jgi:hypothetical protein